MQKETEREVNESDRLDGERKGKVCNVRHKSTFRDKDKSISEKHKDKSRPKV